MQLGRTRATQRKSRHRRSLTTVALVGYTNAGKSTLLNRLTQAEVLVEDRLFSTLDPSTRRLRLPGGEMVLLSDTVGFVRRLPHQLVESFRPRSRRSASADLLVHLVDAGAAEPEHRIRRGAVGAGRDRRGRRCPEQLVFTKSDTVDARDARPARRVAPGLGRACPARSGAGVEELPRVIGDRLRALEQVRRAAGPVRPGRRARRRCTATARCSSRCTRRAAPGCGPGCRRP